MDYALLKDLFFVGLIVYLFLRINKLENNIKTLNEELMELTKGFGIVSGNLVASIISLAKKIEDLDKGNK